MVGAFARRLGRGAIGLIAAYALALQAFLTYAVAAQAAAHGSAAGSFFVICLAAEEGAPPDGAALPAKPSTHCPTCTLADPAAAPVPDLAALPVLQSLRFARTPFLTAQACIAFHEARAGLTRAPPQNA